MSTALGSECRNVGPLGPFVETSLSPRYPHSSLPDPLRSQSRGDLFLRGVVVVQLLSCVRLFATQWTAARQVSLSFTISRSLLKFMSIESVMLSNHLILCCPPLLLPSIFPIIRVFSNELALHIRWPKYWSFSIISPNKYSGLISFRID